MDISLQVKQIAERIRGLRLDLDISAEKMAEVCDTTVEDYLAHENGQTDFSFTFLYKCARFLGVDITELITGDRPTLGFYTVVKKNEGLPIERRKGFKYQHLAYLMKDKISEPFLVTAKYEGEVDDDKIALSTHKGQEFDYILKGRLKVRLENHIEILEEGDCVYYNSEHGHGMVAIDEDCIFLAVVIPENDKN